VPSAHVHHGNQDAEARPDQVHRCHCYFTGRVQGVGFRYTAQNVALQYNVTGFVRNLADGRVELVMEGPDGEIEHLIEALQQRMNGYIHGLDRQSEPATGEFHRFCIRH
jgi:acylphosphatase